MAFVKDGQLPIGATHPSLGSDKTADGIVSWGRLGENVSFGEVLYQNNDGKYYKAMADSDERMPVVTIAVWTEKADKMCPILTQGYIRNDSWSYTLGEKVYVSTDTKGAISLIQPTDYRQTIGNVIERNIIYFNPEHNTNYGYNNRITIKDIQTDVNALFDRQTFNLRYPIWAAGQYRMLKGDKHVRLKIIDAWVVTGDDQNLDQTIEIVGFSDPLYIPDSYDAGVVMPLDMSKGEIAFYEDVIVNATTDRRVTVEMLCEADE